MDEPEVITVSNIRCVKLKDIKHPEFGKWFRGQTGMIHPETAELLVYLDDWEAFKEKVQSGCDRQKDPVRWD